MVMKKPKKYSEQIEPTSGQYAKEPMVGYQAMRTQNIAPCSFTAEELNAEVDESMAQIARGETIGYKEVMSELRNMLGQ